MHNKDQKLLKRIFSKGKKVGEYEFIAIYRHGALLLALPLCKKHAMRTLTLYQPQKWRARLFYTILKVSILTGVYRLRSRHILSYGDEGVFPLLRNSDSIGFLVGGSKIGEGKVIAISKFRGRWMVVKICGEEDARELADEYAVTVDFAGATGLAPKCLWGRSFSSGYAYASEMVEGRGAYKRGDLVKVILAAESWLEEGELTRLSELPVWKELNLSLEDQCALRLMQSIGDTTVRVSIMHGDLTPWNVKICASGDVRVLDWEYAQRRGVPAWDVIHFIVQKYSLVVGWSDVCIYRKVIKLLRKGAMARYLKEAGLTGLEEEVFVLYCYYSSRLLGFEREGLITCWKSKCDVVKK